MNVEPQLVDEQAAPAPDDAVAPAVDEAGVPAVDGARAPAVDETGGDEAVALAVDGAVLAVDGAPDSVMFGSKAPGGAFQVRLHNFEGPFDLLLQLISKHKLDVTEVS